MLPPAPDIGEAASLPKLAESLKFRRKGNQEQRRCVPESRQ